MPGGARSSAIVGGGTPNDAKSNASGGTSSSSALEPLPLELAAPVAKALTLANRTPAPPTGTRKTYAQATTAQRIPSSPAVIPALALPPQLPMPGDSLVHSPISSSVHAAADTAEDELIRDDLNDDAPFEDDAGSAFDESATPDGVAQVQGSFDAHELEEVLSHDGGDDDEEDDGGGGGVEGEDYEDGVPSVQSPPWFPSKAPPAPAPLESTARPQDVASPPRTPSPPAASTPTRATAAPSSLNPPRVRRGTQLVQGNGAGSGIGGEEQARPFTPAVAPIGAKPKRGHHGNGAHPPNGKSAQSTSASDVHLLSSSPSHAGAPLDDEVSLMYDPILKCYYEPNSKTYYQLHA